MRQSKIAVGSGGLTGQGLMEGKQKLFYLPEAHTDFIYAVVGEELGFAGCAGLLMVYVVILWRGLRLVRAAGRNWTGFRGIRFPSERAGTCSPFFVDVLRPRIHEETSAAAKLLPRNFSAYSRIRPRFLFFSSITQASFSRSMPAGS